MSASVIPNPSIRRRAHLVLVLAIAITASACSMSSEERASSTMVTPSGEEVVVTAFTRGSDLCAEIQRSDEEGGGSEGCSAQVPSQLNLGTEQSQFVVGFGTRTDGGQGLGDCARVREVPVSGEVVYFCAL